MTTLMANSVAYSPTGGKLTVEERPMSLAFRGIYVKNKEIVYRRKDTGALLYAESTVVPVPGDDGKPIRYIVTVRDVGERRAKDEALKWLAAIVESSEDAIVGKDNKGIVTSWNRGAEKIFGYTAAEIIGQSILRLLPDDRKEEENEILRRLHLGETVDHFATVRVRKNGESIHVSLTISPIRDADGKLIGASKIARDTTEQIRLERQLHQSQKMEALGNLTGGVAHDFNNLLGVIFGNLDLLERLVAQDEAALKRVHIAQKAANRGADLTRRLLAFSSNMGLKPMALILDHSIRNALELTTRVIGPHIRITSHFGDDHAQVFVDASALESALINVIVNARDAMPNGGTITVSTEISDLEESYLPVQTGEMKAGRYARISVTDTGTGMSRETLLHAFEPYYTTKPRGKGTGLGLAMVYGFARQTGGAVRLYSEAGYGTTVTLYLPLAENRHAVTPYRVEQKHPVNLAGRVLVVDDELDLLEIAAIYLRDMGYTTYQAEDGPGALAVIEQAGEMDLLVTDIIMPGGMNGVELAQQVKQRMPAVKVVYCSGFQADALEEQNMPLIDGPLLQKPYHRAEFEGMIRRVMDKTVGQEVV
jgi:PAS domain S-box-containing protein